MVLGREMSAWLGLGVGVGVGVGVGLGLGVGLGVGVGVGLGLGLGREVSTLEQLLHDHLRDLVRVGVRV